MSAGPFLLRAVARAECAPMNPTADRVPSPQQLFRLWDAGSISREEFHRCMAVHARELIEEMEQAHKNPLVAAFHTLMNRREASKWTRRVGEASLREVLAALAEEDDFPPARWLWNALHPHIPLHVFFRTRGTPVFRFRQLELMPQWVRLVVEHGGTETLAPQVEEVVMRRNRQARLLVERRSKLV